MKLIDTNVYFGKWPFRKAGEDSMEPILAGCRRNGVGGMLVSSVSSIFYRDPMEAEEELYQVLQGKENCWQVMGVNPTGSGFLEDMRIGAEEYHVKAFKLYPGYHGYSLQDPRVEKICRLAREYDLPVEIAGRVEDLRVCHMIHPAPIPLDSLGVFLSTYRENKIVLQNFSFGDTMALAPNLLCRDKVCVDMSGFVFISFPLEKLLQKYPMEMFVFGSQAPLYVQKGILNELTMADISQDAMNAIAFENARRMYGL